MSSKSFFITIGLLMICLHQFTGTAVNGSPYQLNLKKMFETAGELRIKKDGLTSFTPPDEDVIELEHLKSSSLDPTSFDNKNSNNENNENIGGNDGSETTNDDLNNKNIESSIQSAGAGSGGAASVFESAFNNPFEDQIQLENLPSLEKQLEAEAEKERMQSATSQPEREEEMIVQHRPPHSPYPILPPELNVPVNVQQQSNNNGEQSIPTDEVVVPAPAKSYHGAARLAFGQNPEILPTTTSVKTTTTQITDGVADDGDELSNSDSHIGGDSDTNLTGGLTTSVESVVNSPVEVPSSSSTSVAPTQHQTTTNNPKLEIIKSTQNHPAHPGRTASEIRSAPSITTTTTTTSATTITDMPSQSESENVDEKTHNDEINSDDQIVAELEATKTNVQRRSVNRTPPKSAESLLRNSESSFDMAQYVFWTGDEAGVARAVEEFIQQGLISSKGCSTDQPISELPITFSEDDLIEDGEMSRESALKFLKEIRMGIEYLQKSYANRVVPDQKENIYKKRESSTMKIPSSLAVGSSGSMDIGSISNKYNTKHQNQFEQHLEQQGIIDQENLQPNSLNLQRTLDHLPSLMRLQETSSTNIQNNKENQDYNEMTGRAKIAEFLYAEYSLEEVIYQLAKVMFSQSLTHGSEQSQRALQRLTNFLENEGEQGVISPTLQKKILDVLLAALSDTLTDHPELLATARAKLGHTFLPSSENNIDSLRH